MGGILKGVSSVLIALGIIAVIGTGVILYYNTIAPEDDEAVAAQTEGTDSSDSADITEEDISSETESGITEPTDSTVLPAGTSSSVFTAENGHVHTYTSNVLKPATCTDAGEVKYTCYCGDTYVDAIPTKEHTSGAWITVRAATTTQTGLRQKSCVICGRTLEEEVLPMLADTSKNTGKDSKTDTNSSHKHSYTYEITTEANCTTKGEKTYTCSICGSTFKTSIPATNHPSRSTIRTEGDCKNDGKIETKCNICNTVISSEPLTYDHKWGAWTTTTQPTAASDGVQTKTCKVCGEAQTRTLRLSGSAITNSIGNSGTGSSGTGSSGTGGSGTGGSGTGGSGTGGSGTGSSTGSSNPGTAPTPHTHSYTAVVTQPATCTTAGITTYTCSCGEGYTESIPAATGHSASGWIVSKYATITEQGERRKVCTHCNAVLETQPIPTLTESHNHYDYYTTSVLRPPTADSNGLMKYTCSICGYYYTTIIPATG